VITAQAIFIGFFGMAAVWFGVVVFRTFSMVRSAIALLFSQTALGAMFLTMQAEFLGVLQIMMMATEMSIMAIFMVMFMMDPGGGCCFYMMLFYDILRAFTRRKRVT